MSGLAEESNLTIIYLFSSLQQHLSRGYIVPSCDEDDTTEVGLLDGGSPVRSMNGREACSQASEYIPRPRTQTEH